MDDALIRAKKAKGGSSGLAAALSALSPKVALTPQAVSQWDRVPAGRVLDVERVTGVSRHLLRPDLYPAPESDPS